VKVPISIPLKLSVFWDNQRQRMAWPWKRE